MKTLVIGLFLYFLLATTCTLYAGNSSMLVNYPAPSGAYNKIVLQNSKGDPSCTIPSNAGILFMSTVTNSLEICTSDGTAKPVLYPETCFNRFLSCTNGPTTPVPVTWICTNTASCPTGYLPSTTTTNVSSSFQPDPANSKNLWVNSYVCCSQPLVNGTATDSTVILH
jgi:hypothetical protein